MNFKQMMIEKLKANVACKIANDSSVIREVADKVIDELDYRDIAEEMNISSSDIAEEIDHHDIISEISDHLDLEEIRQSVADRCNMNELTEKVLEMLPTSFMDDLAVQAAEEIIEELH